MTTDTFGEVPEPAEPDREPTRTGASTDTTESPGTAGTDPTGDQMKDPQNETDSPA